LPCIEQLKAADFWNGVTVTGLERIRTELRGIIQYRRIDKPNPAPPKIIDVAEDEALVERKRHKVKLDGLDMVAYRNRVQKVLLDIFDSNETLQKIKAGQPVGKGDLDALCSLVLTQEPGLDLNDLTEYYPQAKSLDH